MVSLPFGEIPIQLNYIFTVNFLGPRDEFVVSGSDDGHFFIWNKATGKLHDILEGDGHVVNVVESHPHLPVVAVSGIDTTVKVSTDSFYGHCVDKYKIPSCSPPRTARVASPEYERRVR